MLGEAQSLGVRASGVHDFSTRTWPPSPRSSRICCRSVSILPATMAWTRTEHSTFMLRSSPERNLGNTLVPNRFQASGGTAPDSRSVTCDSSGTGSGTGWGAGTGSGGRNGFRRCTRRGNCLECLGLRLGQQEDPGFKRHFLWADRLRMPEAPVAAIILDVRRQAKVSTRHELGDFLTKDEVRIDQPRQRAVQKTLTQTRKRPGTRAHECRRPVAVDVTGADGLVQ